MWFSLTSEHSAVAPGGSCQTYVEPNPTKEREKCTASQEQHLALVEAWSLVEGGEEGLLSSMEAPHFITRSYSHTVQQGETTCTYSKVVAISRNGTERNYGLVTSTWVRFN